MPLIAAEQRRALIAVANDLNLDGPVTLTKNEILAAIQGVDGYLDANAQAMNLAIPQPARGALTAAQKAGLFAYVALRRYGRD